MTPGRLDLDAVHASLADVQSNFSAINETLNSKREPMTQYILDNMMAGYERVDQFLAQELDLLQREQLSHFLELNHIVLCGRNWARNHEYYRHIYATQDHFYTAKPYNIGELVRWHHRHRHDPVWKRTAGLYVGTVSSPQLFIEGNHRTGALLMSYIMTREGLPPFVLNVDNAKAYFDPSSVIKSSRKRSYRTFFEIPKIKRKFGEFLEHQSDPKYLVQTDPAEERHEKAATTA